MHVTTYFAITEIGFYLTFLNGFMDPSYRLIPQSKEESLLYSVLIPVQT